MSKKYLIFILARYRWDLYAQFNLAHGDSEIKNNLPFGPTDCYPNHTYQSLKDGTHEL